MPVYAASLVSYTLLVIIVLVFPLEFSGYRDADALAPIWYLITESGGFYGSVIILTILTTYLFFHFRTKGRRMRSLAVLILLVVSVEVMTLAFSQLYAKEMIREPRPSQMYFVEKGVIENGGREFFSMPMKEKEDYLRKRTQLKTGVLEEVYPPILSSWTEDTTFSFPSGHSQSSFFLGIMICFTMYKVLPVSRRFLSVLPLIWAVLVSLSRVVIGVHYPTDVCAGALAGLICAFVLMPLDVTQRALTGVKS